MRSATAWIRTGRSIRRDHTLPRRPACAAAFPSPAVIRRCRQRAKPVPGGVQPNLQAPTLISYSLRVQREIFPNTSFSIGYVGTHGYHELLGLDANEPAPVICPASPCPANLPNAYAGQRHDRLPADGSRASGNVLHPGGLRGRESDLQFGDRARRGLGFRAATAPTTRWKST